MVSPRELARLRDDADGGVRLELARLARKAGDPRGDLIEAQCALAAEDPGRRVRGSDESQESGEAWRGHRAREADLLRTHEAEWLAELGLEPGEAIWDRGFIGGAVLSSERFFRIGERLLARSPLLGLRLEGTAGPGDIARLAALPDLGALRTLELCSEGITTRDVQALAASPHVRGLRSLVLAGPDPDYESGEPGLTREGVEAIAQSSALAGLLRLDLRNNRLDDDAVDALCRGQLHDLRQLDLGRNELSDDAIVRLGQSPSLRKLAWLGLRNNEDLSDEAGEAIARSPHLGGLRFVDVTETGIDPEALGTRGGRAPKKSCYLLELSVQPGAARRGTIFAHEFWELTRGALDDELACPIAEAVRSAVEMVAFFGESIFAWVVRRGVLTHRIDLRPFLSAMTTAGDEVRFDDADALRKLLGADEPSAIAACKIDWFSVLAQLPPLHGERINHGETTTLRDPKRLAARVQSHLELYVDDEEVLSYGFQDLEI